METQDKKGTQTTDVTIFGESYALISQEGSGYTRKIADLVNCTMEEIASKQNLGDPTKIGVLAAMDIADRLLVSKVNQGLVWERAREAIQKLQRHIDELNEK